MEIIAVLSFGFMSIFVVLGYAKLHKYIGEVRVSITKSQSKFKASMLKEHKKTRKETQEMKTRQTQVRKDLNKIEKMVKKGFAKK